MSSPPWKPSSQGQWLQEEAERGSVLRLSGAGPSSSSGPVLLLSERDPHSPQRALQDPCPLTGMTTRWAQTGVLWETANRSQGSTCREPRSVPAFSPRVGLFSSQTCSSLVRVVICEPWCRTDTLPFCSARAVSPTSGASEDGARGARALTPRPGASAILSLRDGVGAGEQLGRW